MWRLVIIVFLLYGFVSEFGNEDGWISGGLLVVFILGLFVVDLCKTQNETIAQGGLQQRFPNFVAACLMQSASYVKDNGRVLVFSLPLPQQGVSVVFVLEGGFAHSVRAELHVAATRQKVSTGLKTFDGRDQPVHVYVAWTQALVGELLSNPRTGHLLVG